MDDMKKQLQRFLEEFPKKAKSWAQATDEIRDLSRESRHYLEDYDGVIVEPVDFRNIHTPAEWNSKGRDSIIANYDQMHEPTKRLFYERFNCLFCTE